jgi:cytochrome c oxidase subunit 2
VEPRSAQPRSTSSGHWLRSAVALLAFGAALAACGLAEAPDWSTIQPASDLSQSIQDVYGTVFVWTAGIFVVVELLLVYAIIRYRRRPGDSGVPDQVHGFTALEIAWTLVPAAILFFIAIPTVRTIFEIQSKPPAEKIEIAVIGHQWWWEFEYPDLGIKTANELHLPVGRAASLALTSADVIHSFWVPRLGGKRDLNPGSENQLWFTPDSVGVFIGQCAELCGTSHANMRLKVFVEPTDSFEAWVEQQRQPAVQDTVGLQAFLSSGCAACHAIAGTPAQAKIGPDLTKFGSRSTIAAGLLANEPDQLAAWLRDPESIKPGVRMPNLNLSEERIASLVAYLGSLR